MCQLIYSIVAKCWPFLSTIPYHSSVSILPFKCEAVFHFWGWCLSFLELRCSTLLTNVLVSGLKLCSVVWSKAIADDWQTVSVTSELINVTCGCRGMCSFSFTFEWVFSTSLVYIATFWFLVFIIDTFQVAGVLLLADTFSVRDFGYNPWPLPFILLSSSLLALSTEDCESWRTWERERPCTKCCCSPPPSSSFMWWALPSSLLTTGKCSHNTLPVFIKSCPVIWSLQSSGACRSFQRSVELVCFSLTWCLNNTGNS